MAEIVITIKDEELSRISLSLAAAERVFLSGPITLKEIEKDDQRFTAAERVGLLLALHAAKWVKPEVYGDSVDFRTIIEEEVEGDED